MGFFGKIVGKRKEEQGQEKILGVCIPEARRKIMEKEMEEQRREAEQQEKIEEMHRAPELPDFVDEKPRLVVEGIFAVVDTLMVKGRVASGRINKGMIVSVAKKKFKVKDLQFEGKSAPHLLKGQSGAVFFDKAKGLTFKAGAIIEFKQQK